MSPRKSYSREEILRRLQEFARDSGRPPRSNEIGFGKIKEAAKREFGSWNYALKVAGLQTYKKWQYKNTLIGRICNLLNHNPLTLPELRRELLNNENCNFFAKAIRVESIATAIKQSAKISSIGPRRSKVYYLKGQERLAQNRLGQTPSNLSEKQDLIFCALRKPMTKNEIGNLFSQNVGNPSFDSQLRELAMARLVGKVKFVAGSRGAKKYRASELFGDLACKVYYFRLDCPRELAKFIVQNIPRSRIGNKGFRSALSHHFKRILPQDVFAICMPEINRLVYYVNQKSNEPKIEDFLQ